MKERAASRRVAARQRPPLEVVGLAKSFGRRPVLQGLSFTASPGDLVVVTGVSGAGKTTLLRLLHGDGRPDRGQLWVGGHPLHRRWWRGVEGLRREVGFVFQEPRLLPRLSVLENVVFAMQVAHPEVPMAVIKVAAREALAQVGLAGFEREFPERLSGGERQRVGVARAVAAAPPLILADEPTAHQDEASAVAVWSALRAAAKAGAVVVVATHQLEVEGDRVISLPRLEPNPRVRRTRRPLPVPKLPAVRRRKAASS